MWVTTRNAPRGSTADDDRVRLLGDEWSDVIGGDCGTQIISKAPGMAGAVILKVGTLDDPSLYGGAQMAIFTIDKQSFHHIPDGVATFERLPG